MHTNPICHWAGGVSPLLNWAPGSDAADDPQMPVATVFYDTVAALAAAGVTAAPTFLHPCQEAAGTGTIADVAGGGLDLVAHGNVIQGLPAVGLWDPVNLNFHGYVRRSIEAEFATKAGFNGPAGALGDPGLQSFCNFFVTKRVGNTADQQLLGKKDTSVSSGWEIGVTGEIIRFNVEDTAGLVKQATAGAIQHDDGHYLACLTCLNRATGFMTVWTSDFGWWTPVALAALATISAGVPFALFAHGGGTGISCPQEQIVYHTMWLGAAAESIEANWNAINRLILWPFNSNPTPIWYGTQVEHQATICGDDPIEGVRIAGWGGLEGFANADPGQFPWAYDPTLTRANKLCTQTHPRLINYLNYSDRYDQLAYWTKLNVTVSIAWADLQVAPDGMKRAHLVTATADAGTLWDNNVVVLASQVYGMELFVRRGIPMATDVVGRLVAYDYTNTAEIASVPFLATDKWQHVTLEFTTPVGCIRAGYRIEIATSGESLNCYRSVFTKYGVANSPVESSDASADASGYSRRQSTALVPADTIHGAKGEIEIQCRGFTNADLDDINVLFSCLTAGANNNARKVTVSQAAPHVLACDVYTSAAGAVDHVITYGVIDYSVEHTIRVRWNIAGLPSGNTSEIIVDGGAPVAGSVLPWAASDTCDEVYIGNDNSATGFAACELMYVKIWAEPQ